VPENNTYPELRKRSGASATVLSLKSLTNMCPNETYSRDGTGKQLRDMFPFKNGFKQGDALSPLLFNFVLEHAIRRVQANKDDLKLSGTHQFLVYADVVNAVGGRVHTIKKNMEALLVASKETGLQIHVDMTLFMVMSRDQIAGQNHNAKTVNKSF
jgi:hypothetical protein